MPQRLGLGALLRRQDQMHHRTIWRRRISSRAGLYLSSTDQASIHLSSADLRQQVADLSCRLDAAGCLDRLEMRAA